MKNVPTFLEKGLDVFYNFSLHPARADTVSYDVACL
jgi:hypothetical protein